jgi:hypothetical protein
MAKACYRAVLAFLFFVPLFGECATPYEPEIYKVGPGRIPEIKVNGTVEYVNNQPDKTTQSIEIPFQTFTFDYQIITEGFNRQLKNEISKIPLTNAQQIKTLTSKVKHIDCSSKFGSMVRRCVISVEVVTGAGEVVNIEAKQGSPMYNTMEGALNGTIATGVIDALNHSAVRAYLEK